jgi:hypothetical protein
MLRMTSVRSQRASSISAPHDLRADSEVGRHSLPRTTSVRTRRSGVIFRLARPLCAVCSTSVHHLRFARPRSVICSTSVRHVRFARPRSVVRSTSVRHLRFARPRSVVRSTSVRHLRFARPRSASLTRTTLVRRSLDLGPPRSTSVRRSDSHDLDIGKNERTQEVGERLKRSVNSELLKRSMIDPNRSVNNSKRSVNSTK